MQQNAITTEGAPQDRFPRSPASNLGKPPTHPKTTNAIFPHPKVGLEKMISI